MWWTMTQLSGFATHSFHRAPIGKITHNIWEKSKTCYRLANRMQNKPFSSGVILICFTPRNKHPAYPHLGTTSFQLKLKAQSTYTPSKHHGLWRIISQTIFERMTSMSWIKAQNNKDAEELFKLSSFFSILRVLNFFGTIIACSKSENKHTRIAPHDDPR